MPDWQDNDENKLLRRAQKGDVEAYGKLYESYAGSVYRFLAAHLENHMDAEDLTADVFYRAWRALPDFDARGAPFLAYLLRIARNILVDHYRRAAQVRHVELESAESSFTDPRDGQDGLTEHILGRLERQRLHQVLDQLRPDYRMVLVLRFLSGLSPRETALVMRRSEGAVRVLQHRALAALRDLLSDI